MSSSVACIAHWIYRRSPDDSPVTVTIQYMRRTWLLGCRVPYERICRCRRRRPRVLGSSSPVVVEKFCHLCICYSQHQQERDTPPGFQFQCLCHSGCRLLWIIFGSTYFLCRQSIDTYMNARTPRSHRLRLIYQPRFDCVCARFRFEHSATVRESLRPQRRRANCRAFLAVSACNVQHLVRCHATFPPRPCNIRCVTALSWAIRSILRLPRLIHIHNHTRPHTYNTHPATCVPIQQTTKLTTPTFMFS